MISRRTVSTEEHRLDGRSLAGYAAVYGEDSREIVEHGRAFTERIAPGAFNGTLESAADVKLLFNHNP
jgi:phage head maturation protease